MSNAMPSAHASPLEPVLGSTGLMPTDVLTVPVSASEATLVDEAQSATQAVLAQLGQLRQSYLESEQQLLSRLQAFQSADQALLSALARHYIKDRPGTWVYDPSQKAFVSQGDT